MAFKQGAFQIDPNATPEQIARKRAAIAALMPRYGKAQYIGEGLGQLFQGIGSGISERRLDKIESANTAEATAARDRVFGGGPLSVLGMDPNYGSSGSGTRAPVNPIAPPVTQNPGGLPADVISAVDNVAPQRPAAQETAFNLAAKNIGLNENDQAAALTDFMKTGGVNLDPQTTAWCAAYVNAALGQSGIEGTGSNMARSFLDWGQGVDQPARGDIGVLPRGDPNGPFGHVGFVDGINEDGSVRLLGGNQGDAVSVQNYPAADFLGFRRAGEGGTGGAAPAATSAPQIPINDLYALLMDPWQPPETKALVQSMIAEQQQASDPLRQQQLRMGELQIDALENPQVDPMDAVRLRQAELDYEQDKTGQGAEVPSDIQALQYRAEAAGLVKGTPEYQSFMLNGGGDPGNYRALEMQAIAAGLVKGTPAFQEFMATRGAGVTEAAKVNAGNIADAETGGAAAAAIAQGTVEGKAVGEAVTATSSLESKMDGLKTVVADLDKLADEATYTESGQWLDYGRKQFGLEPRPSAVARAEYIAMVDNQVLPLLRDTFGAAFTAKEGDTLRATLGDADKSPAEKKAVLNAFIAQKERDLKSLKVQAGQGPAVAAPVASGAPQPGMTEDGYMFQGGDPADAANWVKVQ